jgi:hypothetical protein
MKRLIGILCALSTASIAFGMLRQQTMATRAAALQLHSQVESDRRALTVMQEKLRPLRDIAAGEQTRREAMSTNLLDAELRDWLLAGQYDRISDRLSPKLSAALGLQWGDCTNFVLVSKNTLSSVSVSFNEGTNMLSDSVCELLAITPEERTQIEAACAETRATFTQWAAANLQRMMYDGLPEYVIPPSPELAHRLTNTLFSAMENVLGPERAPILWKYEDYWCGMELGYFGAVTNKLLLMRHQKSPSQANLYYADWPRGHGGPIATEKIPGTFRNIFPGGWEEILSREGLEIPKQ